MKFLLFILIGLSLSSCGHPESFYSKNCIYHNWEDGKTHCNKYRVVAVNNNAYQQPYRNNAYQSRNYNPYQPYNNNAYQPYNRYP